MGWMSVVTGVNSNIWYTNNDVSVLGGLNICKSPGTAELDDLCTGSIVMVYDDDVLFWIGETAIFSFYAVGPTVVLTTWVETRRHQGHTWEHLSTSHRRTTPSFFGALCPRERWYGVYINQKCLEAPVEHVFPAPNPRPLPFNS